MAEAAVALTPAQRTAEVTSFSAAAEWTGVMATDRAKWLELRRELLTASDVAAVLGCDPRKSALEVYVDKITPRGPELRMPINDRRFWGNVLEQPVLRAVADYYGWQYRQGGALLRSRKHSWLGATLDAEIDRNDGRGFIDFEGKTTRVTRDWSEADQDLPVHILAQVQSQLLVSGAELAIVFALFHGSEPCQIEVQASPEFHALIVEESEAFMARVTSMDPPAPAGTEASTKALQRLYPNDTGAAVELPAEAVDWSRELCELAEQQKRLESRQTELKNLLRASIGEATFGVMPEEVEGKKFWRWKLQQRAEHVVKASESRVLLAMKNGPDQSLKGLSFKEVLERSSLGASSGAGNSGSRRKR